MRCLSRPLNRAAPAPPAAIAPTVEHTAPAEPPLQDEPIEHAPVTDLRGTMDATTAGELNDIFFTAAEDERRLILLNLHVAAPLSPGQVVVLRDPGIGQRLEAAALGNHREELVKQLAEALRIPREQARRIVRDDHGEPIVVAVKALGISRDVVYRLLMFVNPAVGHSVERVHALATLYDEMTAQAAEGMVAIWQALRSEARAARRSTSRCFGTTSARAPVRRQRRHGARWPRREPISAAKCLELAVAATPLSAGDDVEKIPSRAILDFDDPDVGIEFDLARQIGLDRFVGRRPLFEARAEGAVGVAHRVEFALRRRAEQIRGAVEPADADEHGAGLLGAAPAHDGGSALDLTAAQIGGNPKRGFQTHRPVHGGE